jgi:Tol biopolymer transport system component
MTRHGSVVRRLTTTTGAAAVALTAVAAGVHGAQAEEHSGEAGEALTDSRIVFGAALDGDEEANLYSLVPGDTEPRQITDSAHEDTQPAWSPDGAELLFRSNELGPHNLHRVDAEGGEPVAITEDTSSQGRPAWAPDAERIAYEDHSARRPPQTNGIYTSTPDGEGAEQLTVGGRYPDWDPRGEWLSYVHEEGAHDTWTILWTDPDGGETVDVHSRQDWEITGPEFSPDGAYLAFREQHLVNDTVILNVMERDTREIHSVVAEHGGVGEPTWSPNGEQLAFTSLWPDGRGIYTLDVADPSSPGEPEKVMDIPDPQWPELDWAAR